jgi:hypothetical protein
MERSLSVPTIEILRDDSPATILTPYQRKHLEHLKHKPSKTARLKPLNGHNWGKGIYQDDTKAFLTYERVRHFTAFFLFFFLNGVRPGRFGNITRSMYQLWRYPCL